MVIKWCGYFDIEMLLVVLSFWGIEKILECLIGMFVFVFWDRKICMLMLVCDWFGEKLFYYGWVGEFGRGLFLFVFELKVLCVCLEFDVYINWDVFGFYLRYNYVFVFYLIYEGIYKFNVGLILIIMEV